MAGTKQTRAARGAPDARAVALDALSRVMDGHVMGGQGDPGEALEGSRPFTALSTRDRAFARLLLFTTLRRLGQIDAVVDGFLSRPLPDRGALVRHSLRLGACQLLFLGTAPYAAVNSMVALVGARGFDGFKPLVNALLRRLAAEGATLIAAQDAPRLNTPDWLWQSWQAAYGRDTARAIATAHLAEPPLDLSLKRDPAAWAARLGGRLLPSGSVRLEAAGAVAALAGFDEGAWWVQDAAAALPARLLGDVRGRRVIDIGAAPGGKTAQLAAAGAHVVALDRSAARLRRLRENLSRLDLAADTVTADATTWRPQNPADAVLLDAPCSATGTIRRHPDIPHWRTAQDVARLSALQDRLLDAALAMLAPGGVAVFATCSLQPEECEARVDAALARHPTARRLPIQDDELAGLSEAVTAAGDLRTLPCHWRDVGGMDGFYAARLRLGT